MEIRIFIVEGVGDFHTEYVQNNLDDIKGMLGGDVETLESIDDEDALSDFTVYEFYDRNRFIFHDSRTECRPYSDFHPISIFQGSGTPKCWPDDVTWPGSDQPGYINNWLEGPIGIVRRDLGGNFIDFTDEELYDLEDKFNSAYGDLSEYMDMTEGEPDEF